MDFGPIIDKILKVIPKERNTYLFSATMTTKVAKLQRASLNKPVRVEVSSKSVTHVDIRARLVLISYIQILHRLHASPALSSFASEAQGCSSALPRQRTRIVLDDHLYSYGQRCSAVIHHFATLGIPCHSATRANEPERKTGEFEQVQEWRQEYFGCHGCCVERFGYSSGGPGDCE
jgi:hypothetical protein